MFFQIRSRLNLYFFGSKSNTKLALLAISVAFVVALSAASSAVMAQGSTTGAFKGRVIDSATGKPVPGAKVVMRNVDFDTKTTVIADADGNFAKSSLLPGDYEITVTADGYVAPPAKRQALYATDAYTVLPDPFTLESVQA